MWKVQIHVLKFGKKWRCLIIDSYASISSDKDIQKFEDYTCTVPKDKMVDLSSLLSIVFKHCCVQDCIDIINMGTAKVTKRSKRERTKYTPEQIDILERVFATTHYPDCIATDDLADQLEIPSDKVSIWFQNRRSKFKRETKDSQVSWMRKQIFNQENVPRLLTIPSVHVNKRPDIQKKPHVLSTTQINDKSSSDNKPPSSNLHYKPTPITPTISPIRWEPNLRYTTPSPPFDMSSCAGDILRDSNINPTTARPDHPSDIQLSSQVSPTSFWPSCMLMSSNTHVPFQPPTLLPHYSLFPAMDLTSQQFNLL